MTRFLSASREADPVHLCMLSSGHPDPNPTGIVFMNASTAWILPSQILNDSHTAIWLRDFSGCFIWPLGRNNWAMVRQAGEKIQSVTSSGSREAPA
jgi:hypothetical protein